MNAKADLRRRMKAVRAAIPAARFTEAEAALSEALASMDGTLLVYVSIGTELPTEALVKARLRAGRPVAVPRVTGRRAMEAARLERWDALIPGRFDVPTSEGEVVEPDAVVVPGLAFDRMGGRLGYGAGFYDVWLAAHPCLSIGVGFDEQLVDAVPREAHDRPLDRVFTPAAGWVS